jgi:hypothetical protein
MIWYALLIPVFFTILSYFIIKSYDFWWEFLIPTGITFLFIIISYFVIEKISMYDIEYNGYQITEARYYEYWETYKHRTCYRTVSCGKNCTRSVPYDCSYCDRNSAYWVSVDNFGSEYRISESKYNDLKKRWGNENFVELNRRITKWGFCGKDGDMYKVKWNGNIYDSENSVKTHSFENKIKVSHSAFKFPDISKEQADSLGLYHYPEFYDFYKQRAILAKNFYVKDSFHVLFEYLNGSMGFPHKVKVFTLIFDGSKGQDIAIKQEQYWEGGNQNEIVICIGVDKKGNIDWVKPFSWCDNKRLIVELRENISELKYLEWNSMYSIYIDAISKYYHWKSFEDFNYLKFEPTAGQLWFVYIGALIVSLIGVYITMRIE